MCTAAGAIVAVSARARVIVLWCALAAALPAPALAQTPPAAQNPSPMAEATRVHERLTPKALAGTVRTFPGPAGKVVELWIPERAHRHEQFDLLIHFHGAAWIPQQASAAGKHASVVAVLNLGSGSGIYDRSFRDPAVFDSLLAVITREVASTTQRTSVPGHVTLSGFSAGHGAIRAIIGEPRHEARVHAILLLDGMHTSYVPEGRVLDAGGALDSTNLVAFAHFARAARQGDKRFLVTHSEIFPGTFASTTETAEWLLRASGVKRRAVLRWGPRGMQQLSEAHDGRFTLLGYAGNSAPDHIDQFHAMPELLARLLK